tara:strand:- start:1046 stop:1288 length:243 start_codon:yes stop_codon:yes gene_type:complete
MSEAKETKKPIKTFRKGSLVKVDKAKYENSLEAQASDLSSAYIYQGPGEVLSVKGEYSQIRWRMPVPDVWLRTDYLEEWS